MVRPMTQSKGVLEAVVGTPLLTRLAGACLDACWVTAGGSTCKAMSDMASTLVLFGVIG